MDLRSPAGLAREVLDDVAEAEARHTRYDHDTSDLRGDIEPLSAPEDGGNDADLGPGGSLDPADWDTEWTARSHLLEPLSRALAALLRHNPSCKGRIPLEDARRLVPRADGVPWTASDALLVAQMSTRTCGLRRFRITGDLRHGYNLEARPKEDAGTTSAGPPRRRARSAPTDPAPEKRVTREDLNNQLDAWHSRTAASSHGAEPNRSRSAGRCGRAGHEDRSSTTGVITKMLKRPRGSRGNPDRPSQVARNLRLAKAAEARNATEAEA